MELIPPTNFDDTLVDEFKTMGIKETYGKLAIDFIGGGRPASGLHYVSKRRAAEHIRKLHDAGISFNYLLNASCLGSIEFTRLGRKKIYRLFRWLVDIKVDKITVTIPYLLQLIKDKHPHLKLCVSTIAEVDSLQKALFWQKIGADEITLSHLSLCRNFNQLSLIRKAVSCKLRLIANAGCLYQCPLSQYHTSWDSHASQLRFSNKAGLLISYYTLFCRYLRLLNPDEFIRSQWIRPEDLHIYENIGINAIKLTDRRCSSSEIIKITKAYSERKYQGNLLDLLPAFHGGIPVNRSNVWLKWKYFFHPFETNMFSIFRFVRLMEDIKVYIDNKKLGGFIKKFIDEDCSLKDCSRCLYCDKIAKEVVSYDREKIEWLRKRYKDFLDNFIKGRY